MRKTANMVQEMRAIPDTTPMRAMTEFSAPLRTVADTIPMPAFTTEPMPAHTYVGGSR